MRCLSASCYFLFKLHKDSRQRDTRLLTRFHMLSCTDPWAIAEPGGEDVHNVYIRRVGLDSLSSQSMRWRGLSVCTASSGSSAAWVFYFYLLRVTRQEHASKHCIFSSMARLRICFTHDTAFTYVVPASIVPRSVTRRTSDRDPVPPWLAHHSIRR